MSLNLELDTPSFPALSPDAAWQRQLINERRTDILDQVSFTADGHDPNRPAIIGDQFIDVESDKGWGKIPAVASRRLDCVHPDVDEVHIVQHGEIRDVWAYFENYKKSLGTTFDRDRMLIVALQFPTSADPIDDTVLRWHTNGWRGGEPAVSPSPPIGSIEAEDASAQHLHEICPYATVFKLRNNSEGGQKHCRSLAWSRAYLDLERAGITVEGDIQSAGFYQYWNNERPTMEYFRNGTGPLVNREWPKVGVNSLENRWPYSMYDQTAPDYDVYGPPPDVRDFLLNYSPNDALRALIRRLNAIRVGEEDSTREGFNGSRLPIGAGPDAQGPDRVERGANYWLHLRIMAGRLGIYNKINYTIHNGTGHTASSIFNVASPLRWLESFFEPNDI